MESVDQVIPLPEEVILQDIFGSKKTMKAKISHLVLLDHKIVLESIS